MKASTQQDRGSAQLENILGRSCRRNLFLDHFKPVLESSTRASFVGRQQVEASFSGTIALLTSTLPIKCCGARTAFLKQKRPSGLKRLA